MGASSSTAASPSASASITTTSTSTAASPSASASFAPSTSTAASTSTSTSAAANPNDKSYAVFINHRGVDVKKTFARSLYLRLLDNGFTAFLDEEEMQAGYNITSQIEHAVRTATVHVAIFSPRYAESVWCLQELALMVESKAPIIPVFYRVTPAHVRWTQGKYGQDLQTHEEKGRHDRNTIDKWKDALFKVTNNSGFELETCNGAELVLELLDKVVKRLSKMVKTPDLHVAQFPTGLDEKMKDFEDTVLLEQQQSGRPQILGIWGLGGVGKTTLAKEFFNRKKSHYQRSCFLFDVKDNAAKGSLMQLQREFLKCLSGLDKPITNIDEGTGMLKEHINNLILSNALKEHIKHLHRLAGLEKPIKSSDTLVSNNVSTVLVILDDVDHVDQVNALLPIDLPSGSLILITSRDKHVLEGSKIPESSIYKLTGLNEQHSLELFCSYAFSQTYPRRGFESIVYSFLEACNGLPLSLKVFGANLYGRDISYWEDELGSFPTEIKERYKVSYDALNDEEKHMFLDSACFLIGQNRDTAMSIWDASGWKPRRGFQNLQDKCLAEVDSLGRIGMHDHLRDMGRDLAEKSSPHRLWRWSKNTIEDLLQQSSVIPVRGIRMDLSEYNEDVDDVLSAIRTRRLQIIDTEGSLLKRILTTGKVPNILWIRWRDCPYPSLPSWIPMNNLRILHVSGSVINTLWQREGESQEPLPLPLCLEEFSADGCVQLKSIHGLERLIKLRRLHVEDCFQLEELPMETLTSLEVLRVKGCMKLKSIRGLEHATKLTILSVYWLPELAELPSMETLTSLEQLRAGVCVKLKSIRGLSMLRKLRKLSVRGCLELEEVEGVEDLTWLEKLDVFACPKLQCPVNGGRHVREPRNRKSSFRRSKLAMEQSFLIGWRRSKVSVDFVPPPSDGGRFAP